MENNIDIDYYEINKRGFIDKYIINTADKNYISHTDDSVTFSCYYIDTRVIKPNTIVTKTRIFETIKQEFIKNTKDSLDKLQKKFDILNNSEFTNYEQYKIYESYF